MDWSVVWDYRQFLAEGLWLTVQLSLGGIIGSTLLGVAVGCLGTLPSYFARRLISSYVSLLRNLPLILKLFFLHFVLGVNAYASGLIALTLHQSAYIADLTTSGLRSIPSGQTEAALALGHSRRGALWYVIAPQVIRTIIPALITQYVGVIKNSAVAMLLSLQELTFMTQKIEHETLRGFEAVAAATILYLSLMLIVTGGMTALHRTLRRPS
ncbi:amino acid ABC transporter permease [Pseudorhodoplanes sp.]|uniref:amino acid ABC transporter permease n=1 Tax=Pseudorhodoplanes sp. TaxID=1934341 RepID=UPI003D118CE5